MTLVDIRSSTPPSIAAARIGGARLCTRGVARRRLLLCAPEARAHARLTSSRLEPHGDERRDPF
eukprot:1671970-Pleurochrysis_carterae.AAC.1